jgi:hypothetical protein
MWGTEGGARLWGWGEEPGTAAAAGFAARGIQTTLPPPPACCRRLLRAPGGQQASAGAVSAATVAAAAGAIRIDNDNFSAPPAVMITSSASLRAIASWPAPPYPCTCEDEAGSGAAGRRRRRRELPAAAFVPAPRSARHDSSWVAAVHERPGRAPRPAQPPPPSPPPSPPAPLLARPTLIGVLQWLRSAATPATLATSYSASSDTRSFIFSSKLRGWPVSHAAPSRATLAAAAATALRRWRRRGQPQPAVQAAPGARCGGAAVVGGWQLG